MAQKAESLEEFYDAHPARSEDRALLKAPECHGHFNVYPRGKYCRMMTPYNRRDFYKISLIIGKGKLYYADREITIHSDALVFFNPHDPYAWESISKKQEGYFCLFSDDFLSRGSGGRPGKSGGRPDEGKRDLRDAPLFGIRHSPVFFLDPQQVSFVSGIFIRMIQERASGYGHKYDLLRNYVQILVHEALKLQPAPDGPQQRNAASRIASLFLELLENQFPVDPSAPALACRTPADFAARLAVHVNHLNRAVKDATGKTTSEHIAARILKEAKDLLLHSDQSVAEIAYSLGFEYPAYFQRFFKQQTRQTPGAFRA